jgi:hypothetical protein
VLITITVYSLIYTIHVFAENKLVRKECKTFDRTEKGKGKKMKRIITAAAMCVVTFVLAQFASADTVTWDGSAGDFLWATPSNWDTGNLPVSSDALTTIPSSSSAIQIASGEIANVGRFYVAATGDASLNVAGTLIMTNGTVFFPYDSGHTATVTVPSGGVFDWSGDCYVAYKTGKGFLTLPAGAVSAKNLFVGKSAYGEGGTAASKAVLVADDFDLTLSGSLSIGDTYSTGYYTNSGGGEISCVSLYVGTTKGIGVFALESGKVTASGDVFVARYGGSDGLIVAGDGTEIIGDEFFIGGLGGDDGIMQLGAMTLRQTKWGGKFHIGYDASTANGTLELRGTTVIMNQGSDLRLGVLGSIIGYGSISVGSYSSAYMDNSGLVTASGFGIDQDLTFSNQHMAQTTAGNGTNGWYAVNGGRLALPAITVSAGNSTNNLAETSTATVLDLVNSVQVELVNATAGSLSYKLYASERTDVPAGLETEIVTSVWEISAPAFDSAELTFKLPDVDAADNLKLLRYTGTSWKAVGTVDATTDFSTTTTGIASSGDDNLGFFAVASMPSVAGTFIIIN